MEGQGAFGRLRSEVRSEVAKLQGHGVLLEMAEPQAARLLPMSDMGTSWK
jgi:hypothetical protein